MLEEMVPHVYVPAFEAMGDCDLCGHLADSPWHVSVRVSLWIDELVTKLGEIASRLEGIEGGVDEIVALRAISESISNGRAARINELEAVLAEARLEIIHYGSMAPFKRRDYGPMLVKIDRLIGDPS